MTWFMITVFRVIETYQHETIGISTGDIARIMKVKPCAIVSACRSMESKGIIRRWSKGQQYDPMFWKVL